MSIQPGVNIISNVGLDPKDKGYFANQTALTTAYPTGQVGWFAVVNISSGVDHIFVWDTGTSAWVDTGSSATGTVTSVSVVSANGLAGSVANPTTTPAITLSTSVTGVLKGNGTAISSATAGTDYSAGTSALSTGILKSTTTTGALSIAVAGDFPTLNQNTTGTASNVTGTVAVGHGGTGTTTQFTAGSVVFAGASGVYTQDATNFFYDATNYRLGIQNNAPSVGIHLGTGGTSPHIRLGDSFDMWGVNGNCIFQPNYASKTFQWVSNGGVTTGTFAFDTGLLTTGSTTLHATSVALTNGAGSSVGTLTNAPAVGNPTKWIPINDNGTTRYIPAW